jgi:hypothetical protein
MSEIVLRLGGRGGAVFCVCSRGHRGQCQCSQQYRGGVRRQQLHAANRLYPGTDALRRAPRIAGCSGASEMVVGCFSLIVCAQCFSRDGLTIEKDCLDRVISRNIREWIFLEQEQVSFLSNLDGT